MQWNVKISGWNYRNCDFIANVDSDGVGSNMRWNVKRIVFFILGVYFLISCYTGYKLIQRRLIQTTFDLPKVRYLAEFNADDSDWNPWGQELEKEGEEQPKYQPPKILWSLQDVKKDVAVRNISSLPAIQYHVVEIWGKAAIGLYLWEHILNGTLRKKLGGVWSYGMKRLDNIEFRFRTGPGVKPSKVPKETQNVILVLNGRSPEKIEFSKRWLDVLPNFPNLKNAGLVLLGDEQCNNDWLKPYLRKNGGLIQYVFLVYDSTEIDNEVFYQWPLGVATYRSFPKVDASNLALDQDRNYSCNFLGTIYKNSSREVLLNALQKDPHQRQCYIKARYNWLPLETDASREEYIKALTDSDLTLNPVGQNTECYRIYEAMSYGSVPVIEDVITPGRCGNSSISHKFPLRLLKEEKAPVIYIKDWRDIGRVIDKEMALTKEYKFRRRRDTVFWYESFKSKMKDRFVRILQNHFFPVHR